MRDFQYLLAAWIAVWAIFSVYEISVGRRIHQLREEINRLNLDFPKHPKT